jgi:hypothetical protein
MKLFHKKTFIFSSLMILLFVYLFLAGSVDKHISSDDLEAIGKLMVDEKCGGGVEG